MSATSEFLADATRRKPDTEPILVWDLPVRLFHWLMVLSFTGAWITAESERWRLVHVTLGYTMAGLVAFRLLWGLLGTRPARFSNWVRGPRAVLSYIGALLRGQSAHCTGHNPLGAVAIVLMLTLTAMIATSGWATYNDLGGGWLEDLHEGAATFMLIVVGVHVAGVLLSSWLHRENLIGAMIHGRKQGQPEEGAQRAWSAVAAIVLACVLGFWWLQWRDSPAAGTNNAVAVIGLEHHEPHRNE
ncbi:MAG TPA: cytochrome b/b6 domain-containing protein [Steroidobacteraceae bacterium]|nr:cytochrome b/b6 domain-containing protein [Steroidobacteraceae bacterium]HRX88149.1 cytochrome b/b6 domain-containing protein [Steroidobacteraceae bacterium]